MSILDANIFGKNLFDVTTDDVRDFCDKQIKEGINLDYKAQVNRSLAKTIAAMANTLGGWIIIGVEDEDDRPKAPYEGIDFEQSLPLKVTNLVIDRISPPSLPVIHVCPEDSNNKTFIILYVPQSPEAPHWLFNDNKLPIRLHDRATSTDWERLATSSEWEFLRNKRQQATELFDDIYETLDDLFVSYDNKSRERHHYASGMTMISPNYIIRTHGTHADEEKINILVSPKYPHKKLFNPAEHTELARELRIHDGYGTGDFFPFLSTDFELYQHGIHHYSADEDRGFISFFAIDEYGMLLFREKITEQSASDVSINLEKVLVKYKQTLLFAKAFYEKFAYYGELEVRIVIQGEEWMKLKMSQVANLSDDLSSPLSTISHTNNTRLQSLLDDDHVNLLVNELYQNVANAFKWEVSRRHDLTTILARYGL